MKKFYKIGYQYNELNKSAKGKAKLWYLDDPFRAEILTENFQESYLKYFFPNSNLDIQWSLSSCQGDGVNIYGNIVLQDMLDYIKKYNYDAHKTFTSKELRCLEWCINYDHNSIDAATIPANNHYCYCIADSLDFAYDLIDDLNYWNIKNINNDLIVRFQNAAIDIIENLCSKMEDAGYKYLYECDDGEVQEMCEANEWYFDEAGCFISNMSATA